MTSDFNTGIVSQATLQITESTDETFFCHMQQPFHSSVNIEEVKCSSWFMARIYGKMIFHLSRSIRTNTIYGMTDVLYIYKQIAKAFAAPCGARSGSPQ